MTRVREDQSTASPRTVRKTQNDGLNDHEAFDDVQDGYVITPLSQWSKWRNVTPVIDSLSNFPCMLSPCHDQSEFEICCEWGRKGRRTPQG